MVGGINNNKETVIASKYGSEKLRRQVVKNIENDSVKFSHKKAKDETPGILARTALLITGAIVAVKNKEKLGPLVKKAWNGIKGLLPKAKGSISESAKRVADKAKDIVPKAKTKVSEGTKKAMDHVEKMHIKDTVTGTLRSIKNVLSKKS